MSVLELYPAENNSQDHSKVELKQSRKQIIDAVKNEKRFDIVVVGGGIQGAVFARLAAFNGFKTLLLEVNDYASGTSGRTSKMAHGGLRYLEQFDFKQVREGVKAREELFVTAKHLVHPQPFLLPIFKGETLKRIKLWVGLTLYNIFQGKGIKFPKFLKPTNGAPEMLSSEGKKLSGFYSFTDGLMHDTRLVHENIFAARQEGAFCLNYARVDTVYQQDQEVKVAWTDVLSGEKIVSNCGVAVNVAGPWANSLGRISADKNLPEVRFSQGTHLLFDFKWNNPALLIPLKEKGRNYFVWPHFAGTLIGTTEKELVKPEFFPIPHQDEVNHILSMLKSNFPELNFTKDKIIYAYSGIRTLPSTSTGKNTSKLSRRHIWSYAQGILTLIGGKYTTAHWTAKEGLNMVLQIAGIKKKLIGLEDRLLPGAHNLERETLEFKKLCDQKGISPVISDSVIRRLGSRCKILIDIDPELRLIEGRIFWADLIYAVEYEQAETLEDIISRRLDLEFEPDQGFPMLCNICLELEKLRPDINWPEQAEIYRSRIESLLSILRSAN